MIGQSVINVQSGGRGRLALLTAGLVLIFLIVFLGDIVSQIPMAALVGVMIMVSIGTFDWNSLKTITIVPFTDNIVMVLTVVTVIFTHNLAIGVLAGILLSSMFFVNKISKVHVKRSIEGNRMIMYFQGELFFASVTDLIDNFDFSIDEAQEVVLNFNEARLWDDSAVVVLDKIVRTFEAKGVNAYAVGLSKSSSDLNKKLARKLSSH